MKTAEHLTPNLVLLTIVDDNLGKDVENLYRANNLDVNYTLNGTGAASPDILSALGFGQNEKKILVSLIHDQSMEKILFALGIVMNMNEEGRGIAFTIPISSPNINTSEYFQMQTEQNKMEHIENNLPKDRTHDLIITFLYEHSFEQIMNAARSAGATGGTEMFIKDVNINNHCLFFDSQNYPETDIVLILVPKEIKTKVMEAINKLTQKNITANRSCITFPVYSNIGLAHIAMHH